HRHARIIGLDGARVPLATREEVEALVDGPFLRGSRATPGRVNPLPDPVLLAGGIVAVLHYIDKALGYESCHLSGFVEASQVEQRPSLTHESQVELIGFICRIRDSDRLVEPGNRILEDLGGGVSRPVGEDA